MSRLLLYILYKDFEWSFYPVAGSGASLLGAALVLSIIQDRHLLVVIGGDDGEYRMACPNFPYPKAVRNKATKE